ncbi:S-adenosyl-L-methionine-dependent methyltransferase [Basidiobolus meristosporus CBS 931.73]|uniref:tRNA (cytosine(38)-C(5))-methyltransferase n=1 Tax=Basidiobolus meristosporus CBS 931.73 TaxID=1314790 RepID=A0A1Y1Z8F4_9FUNG|nr:S-adenosyl-L-methionine-dependent methyltransferase [Basidiobolus meristosporus CBS 931.73]|eukprot:ORY06287.1 S-adenosyl-L-methionine-dependent methyltransferase [Basidiobolus meristosporus CBS 931.73]
MSEEYRILEFYSGIGGMHYAFQKTGKIGQVLKAFDINTTANNIYLHNFPDKKKLAQRNIEALPYSHYEKLNANVYLMSPPCQPYTRTGLQNGSNDPRAKSFLFLIEMFGKMKNPPEYILVENVKGFETSDTRQLLVDQLAKCNYTYQEFLLTPLQFGIPNSRLRYYLVAKLSPKKFKFAGNELMYAMPHMIHQDPNCLKSTDFESRGEDNKGVLPIHDFLEDKTSEELAPYMVQEPLLQKHGYVFDITKPSSHRSCCFTKGYHHYAEATGSILQMNEALDTHEVFLANGILKDSKDSVNNGEEPPKLTELQLRYFTEREIANLMGFPAHFTFPENATLKQRYRALGNSLNVTVVSELIKYMLDDE